MDVSIELNHPNATFTNGDIISGNVVIYCPNTTITVSKISASLTGDTKSTLTGSAGLLMSRKENEIHRIVRENQVLLPQWNKGDSSRVETLKLAFGYHRFSFALKVPWFLQDPTDQPNSPVSRSAGDSFSDFGPPTLPPSLADAVRGAAVLYHIEVVVTIYRNLFKLTTRKSMNVSIWPVDKNTISILPSLLPSLSATKSVTVNILSPPSRPPTPLPSQAMHLHSTVAESTRILITAHFLPDFYLSHGQARNIAIRLTAQKLSDCPYGLYLESFQLLLFAYTDIRAGTATSGQMTCWTLQSLSNLGLPLFVDENECEIDSGLWAEKCIPETAVPSFSACNLARRYEIEILLGLQCRGASKDQAGRVLVVQLRVPIRIPSGVAPGRNLDGARENVSIGSEPLIALDDGSDASINEGHTTRGIVDTSTFPSLPTYEEAIFGMKRPLR